MLIFKELTFKNFLSSGNTPIEFDFLASRSTLMIGTNGSGKSTMLDALSFVLFGKPHRNINKPQLVNSINQKDCLVEVKFTNCGNDYHIIRGIKPAIFEIWQNGVLLNRESCSRDYQSILESNILKLNHKSFHQVVVLGSGNFIPFMQLPAWQRREVIEELLDIDIFSRMNVLLKDKTLALKSQYDAIESNLAGLKDKLALQETHIAVIDNLNAENLAQYTSNINDLVDNILELEKQNTAFQDESLASLDSIIGGLTKKQEEYNQGLVKKNQCKHEISALSTEGLFYEQNVNCPTCAQAIETTFRSSKMDSLKSRARILSEDYRAICDSADTLKQEAEAMSTLVMDLKSKKNAVVFNNRAIESYQQQIAKLKLKSEQHKNSNIAEAQNVLIALQTENVNLLEKKSHLSEERTYHEVAAEMLKDTGVKTKIIRQYLPVMNKLINQHLHILDFFISFHLDDNFNEVIRSRHRDTFGYASFSEGEKQRIDLALLFAWRQVAKLKNSVNTNLLILDEVFDSSLDTDGVDNLLKILSTLTNDTNVFIISHKRDILDGKFSRKIEFSKQNNFSAMRISS